jgi:hypothetical protein
MKDSTPVCENDITDSIDEDLLGSHSSMCYSVLAIYAPVTVLSRGAFYDKRMPFWFGTTLQELNKLELLSESWKTKTWNKR